MNRFMLFLVALFAVSTLWIVAGCDVEDAVKDQVDTSFEKEVEMELDPLVYDDTGAAKDGECGITSVNEQLEAHDIDLNDITINNIELQYVEAKYKNATWTPEDLGQVTCTMFIWGEDSDGNPISTTITETAVKGKSSGWTGIDLSSEAESVINYYLEHRGDEFEYCVECTDGDSHHVEYYVQIGVLVEGEHNG